MPCYTTGINPLLLSAVRYRFVPKGRKHSSSAKKGIASHELMSHEPTYREAYNFTEQLHQNKKEYTDWGAGRRIEAEISGPILAEYLKTTYHLVCGTPEKHSFLFFCFGTEGNILSKHCGVC